MYMHDYMYMYIARSLHTTFFCPKSVRIYHLTNGVCVISPFYSPLSLRHTFPPSLLPTFLSPYLPYLLSLFLYSGVEKEYQAWTKEFDVQSRQSEISQLLVTCPHIRTIHGKLVPAKVSYENFWQRYFFKLGLLQQVILM